VEVVEMIESVFGSLLKEKILVYITVNPESYPNEISRVFQSSLSSVQKHLENLEKKRDRGQPLEREDQAL
jgi:predicted transcriptional regulator with HTH domain